MNGRPLIIERGTVQPIPASHPVYAAGGTRVHDCTILNWDAVPVADDFAVMEDVVGSLAPGQPIVLKLHGIGKGSWDCCNPDTTGKATVEHVFKGLESGAIDVSDEMERLRPFATLVRGAGFDVAYVLADDEPGFPPWKVNCPDGNPRKALFDDADARMDRMLTLIYGSNQCRQRLGPVSQTLPRDPAGILAAWNWTGGVQPPKFRALQCELAKFWGQMRVKAMKTLLQGVGLYPGPLVVHAFIGAFNNSMHDANGWEQPAVALPAGWCSNQQFYDGIKRDRDLTRHAHAFVDAPRWFPTWSAADSIDAIADRLEFDSPNGAVLYTENADDLNRHLVTIARYTAAA